MEINAQYQKNTDHYPLIVPYGAFPLPTPTPSPEPTMVVSPTPEPTPMAGTFPETLVIVASIGIAFAAMGLLVYLKKRHDARKNPK